VSEVERSFHDALCAVKRVLQHHCIVPGGGAVETELSIQLSQYALQCRGAVQLVIEAFADALTEIPCALADNSGMDTGFILAQLRHAHSKSRENFSVGIDINNHSVADMNQLFVMEPFVVKVQALSAATEAACMILSINQTIQFQKHNNTK
jgi:T-complex protein 1 subunit eta